MVYPVWGKSLKAFIQSKQQGHAVIFRANLVIMSGFQDLSSAAGAVWFS